MTEGQDTVGVAIVKACAGGDGRAWEELVRVTYPAVYRQLYWLTHNREEAKDLAQDTFLRLLEPLPDGRPRLTLFDPDRLPFEKFLRVVAYRTFLNHLASWKHKLGARTVDIEELSNVLVAHQSPAVQLEQQEVWRALEALPERQRIACLLSACGWSYDEISGQLGIGSGGTGALIHRARQTLARLLSDDAGVTPVRRPGDEGRME